MRRSRVGEGEREWRGVDGGMCRGKGERVGCSPMCIGRWSEDGIGTTCVNIRII